ncbi:hypothetical protein [Streptomyces griseorubiginosus]|uniref:hypothetical protein n=1 Tax=Streptomyces griseorubiginosus TaxID=67304 RepID=UPI0036E0F681
MTRVCRAGTPEETAALVPEGAAVAVRPDVSRPDEVAAVLERYGRVDPWARRTGTSGPVPRRGAHRRAGLGPGAHRIGG